MFRPGVDPNNVAMTDVLCDFCERPWSLDVGMIEGHQGHVICGQCVRVAYSAIGRSDDASTSVSCTMCLEDRVDEAGWVSPVREEACVCRRCIRMAATALEHDDDINWTRPDV